MTPEPLHLSEPERAELRRAMAARQLTVFAAAALAGVSRQTFAFALAGLEIRRGSAALIREWIQLQRPDHGAA